MIPDEAQPTPAEQAMADIEAHLERWFNGEQTQSAAMAAVCQISGRYKMEALPGAGQTFADRMAARSLAAVQHETWKAKQDHGND